jgi:hypothetical protein
MRPITRSTLTALRITLTIVSLSMGPGINLQSYAQTENETAETEEMERS